MRAERLDPGMARERYAQDEERRIEKRKALVTEALWAGLQHRENHRPRLLANAGVWWPELAPLTPHERTAVIVKLRATWGLPKDPRMKPAEGRPHAVDAPTLARPE